MANTKITSRVIADDAVTTAAIADDAITSALIADDAVGISALIDHQSHRLHLKLKYQLHPLQLTHL